MREAPVIGLTVDHAEVWSAPACALPVSYVEAVVRAGGVPVLLPPHERSASLYGGLLDGLVLTGGGDLEPGRYGAHTAHDLRRVNPARDESELALARWALEVGLPVLGICRGLQVLNVAVGGTLVPHLPDATRPLHDGPGAMRHEVVVSEHSHLAGVLGVGPVDVTSLHHQAIDVLGDGLRVVAWAPDQVVEAVEDSSGHCLAVQWHPEADAGSDQLQQALFDDLVGRARNRAAALMAAR